jgi:ATP-dependent DNA helicase RecG
MLDMKLADLVDDEPLVCATRDEIHDLLEADPDLQQPENRPLRQHIAQSNLLPHWDKIS